jgi:hypothetical protein
VQRNILGIMSRAIFGHWKIQRQIRHGTAHLIVYSPF